MESRVPPRYIPFDTSKMDYLPLQLDLLPLYPFTTSLKRELALASQLCFGRLSKVLCIVGRAQEHTEVHFRGTGDWKEGRGGERGIEVRGGGHQEDRLRGDRRQPADRGRQVHRRFCLGQL